VLEKKENVDVKPLGQEMSLLGKEIAVLKKDIEQLKKKNSNPSNEMIEQALIVAFVLTILFFYHSFFRGSF
jgi:hypothetical protein